MIVLEKEKMKLKDGIGKISNGARRLSTPAIVAITLVAAFFVVFMAYHGYILARTTELKTEIAFPDTVRSTLNVKMFVVRDEKVLNETKGENIVSAVSDGTRVGRNDTIAYSFSDSTSAGNLVRMNEIKELLNYYNSLSGESVHIVNDTSMLDERIMSGLYDFSSMVASGNLTSLSAEQSELRDAITSKQTATGVELDLTEVVSQLEAEYKTLSSAVSAYRTIQSPDTGYFIDGTDGCEAVLDYDRAEEWTVDDIENAIGSAVAEGDGSRIVHGYYWYLACVVDKSQMESLTEGRFYSIIFPDTGVDNVYAECFRCEYDEHSGRVVVVFRCLSMNEELAGLRCENAKIVTKEISGFRVNKDAYRSNENNEKGVYVVSGAKMVFRKIVELYAGDEYCIVENVATRDDDEINVREYIARYDEYIVEGRDLAHGKLIED